MKDGGDIDQTLKLKILTMSIKPTLYRFIAMFVGVVVREKVVVPLRRITSIYSVFSEVVWLWIYNGTNMAPQHENYSHAYRNFFFT